MRKLILCSIFVSVYLLTYSQTIPLIRAHSHNDYNRVRPLHDALENGFTSVEADILYIYGELYVGHNMPDSANHNLPTLSGAYLWPLYQHYKANGNQIYPGYEGDFYLWIDIKFESYKAYRKLKQELMPYKDMLNYWEDGKPRKGKVTVILSGDRPIQMVKNESLRLVTLDGRMADLEKEYDSDIMPFVSQNRRDIFKLDEHGEITAEEYEKLKRFVQQCFDQGKKTRLWATPEDERIWQKLLDAGVDLINTDNLEQLKNFLLKK